MAEISKVSLGGTVYDIKDAVARQALGGLSGAMHYVGETSTALVNGATTETLEAKSSGSLQKTTGFSSGDVVIYGDKEFVFNGTSWAEFGPTGSLKALAFKDSASGSFTPQGSNSASAVSLTGGSTSKLATTSIKGVAGTETVSAVSKTSKKLATTSITPTNGTETVSAVSKTSAKLATTSITPAGAADTVHDTPTLNKSSVGSASNWNAGTMFSASVSDEVLTLNAGTAPSLTVTPTQVGTGLTAGAEKSFATVGTAVVVATGKTAASDTNGADVVTGVTISEKTVAKAGSAITVATGALADTDTNGAEVVSAVSISNKTVATAAASATTVATGQVAADGGGATVATALPTGGTAAAQTFTGTAGTVTVS